MIDYRKGYKAMTTNDAKKIIKTYLLAHNLPFTKLTAKTVSFSDLARGSCIFVKVHGWKPNPAWNDVKQLAKKHGFCVETNGIYVG